MSIRVTRTVVMPIDNGRRGGKPPRPLPKREGVPGTGGLRWDRPVQSSRRGAQTRLVKPSDNGGHGGKPTPRPLPKREGVPGAIGLRWDRPVQSSRRGAQTRLVKPSDNGGHGGKPTPRPLPKWEGVPGAIGLRWDRPAQSSALGTDSSSVIRNVVRRALMLLAVVATLAAGRAYAAPTYFSGIDPNATNNTQLVNSAAAQTSFLTSAGNVTTYTFETTNFGGTDAVDILGGLNVGAFSIGFTGTDAAHIYNETMELEQPGNSSQTNGFNTTAGGDAWAFIEPTAGSTSVMTFTFTKPIDAFGFYLNGLGNNDGTVTAAFNDGAPESFSITGGQDVGGAEYYGFVDKGALITSITFTEVQDAGVRDRYGIDDIAYQTTPPNVTLTKSVAPTGAQEPGAVLTYTVAFKNTGGVPAQTFILADEIPTHTDFKVGSPTETLGTTGLTAAVQYSSNGGTSWTYTPVSGGGGAAAGFDALVTNLRWRFTGNLSQTSPNNSGSVAFSVRIN
jgi:uncharacterized repeat protein (TIGR01451 family)